MSAPVLPIEEWVEVTNGAKELLQAFTDHANNEVEFPNVSNEEDFKRHCAISLREFLTR